MARLRAARPGRVPSVRGVSLLALACACMAVAGCERLPERVFAPPPGPEPVKVGLLHSQTGTMAISETSLRDAEELALMEIDAAGGVLGRPVEAVVEDGRSRSTDIFPRR
ncbi:MAG: transporter substrate-binding protein, partial [Alphaproteobacteria bacterium]